MLHSKFRQALLAGAAAATTLLSPYAAEAGGITVYVAANFTGTAKVLLDRFVSIYGDTTSTYSIAGGATGNLVAAIVNGGSYSSGTVTYPQADLLFAANTQALTTLATVSSTRLTYAGFDTSTHYGWVYAQGFLELYSASSVDVSDTSGSAGLPGGAYPFTPALVIAKPSTAPYGHAALQVLKANYSGMSTFTDGFAFPTTSAAGVVTAADIGLTYQSVASQTASWGFVALSQIATYDAQALSLHYSTTNHYAYESGTDYDPILQGAVKVQGAGDTGFRDAFAKWLTSRDAQAILLQGGYAVPYPVYAP